MTDFLSCHTVLCLWIFAYNPRMCVHFLLNVLSYAEVFFDIESVTRTCNGWNTFV